MADIVLVPGFWLGAWAWDQVTEQLTSAGHRVTALTLPGLESPDTQRAGISLDDHTEAVLAAARAAAGPAILVAHSGGGAVVHQAIDRLPEKMAAAIYVDSGPLRNGVAINADLPPDAVEIPVPDLHARAHELDDDAAAAFARRAVPHPSGPARDLVRVSNPARRRVPAVVICCTYSSDQVRKLVAEGMPFFAELRSLDATYVDLPTGHYPMWSRPTDLAAAIDNAASAAH